jgi:hypothetical protein
MTWPLIHRFGATGGGTPVNAYILEGAAGTVVVDATLLAPDARALRERVDSLGKPLLGVVLHARASRPLRRPRRPDARPRRTDLRDGRRDRRDPPRRRGQGADPAPDVR